jgi:transposase
MEDEDGIIAYPNSQEFRDQSVKFFKESGLPLVEAAKRLSLFQGALKNCVYAAKRGELAAVGKHQKPLTELELELSRVKRELAEVKMKRDFIKKYATYFAKESR